MRFSAEFIYFSIKFCGDIFIFDIKEPVLVLELTLQYISQRKAEALF